MSFNQAEIFSYVPSQGAPYDISLVGYWNLNEGSGTITHDLSGNGNNGILANSTTWGTGKFGNGLNFNGVSDNVNLGNSSSFSFLTSITVSLWVKFEPLSKYGYVFAKAGSYMIYADENGFLHWWVYTTSGNYDMGSVGAYADGAWHLVACTFDSTLSSKQLKIYVDGVLSNSHDLNGTNVSTSNNLFLGAYESSWRPFKGAFDEVRIYNRVLSATEIAALYTLPDPVSLANYYNYKDSVSNNTLTVYVGDPSTNSNNIALVTCTNLFTSNRLVFQANNSATVNVWTNLGQPAFITDGVWNSNNYTTTLTLDASSTGELDWNPNPPSASNLSLSSTIVSKTAAFSSLWSDDHSLSGGGHIFSTNNTGSWVNASWTPFSSTPCWGNVTLTLNSKAGVVVGFREFANDSLGLWGDSGIYAITTTADTSAVTTSPSGTPTASPPPTTTTSTPTANPTTSPTILPETNLLSTQIVAIIGTSVAVLVAVFALAFKKGYITIEVVDGENSSQDENQDYSI